MENILDVDGNLVRLYHKGNGDRVIVYLHSGAGEVCELPFFSALADAGSTVIVPEFPGFGGSKPMSPRLRRIEDAIFHLRRMLDLVAPDKQVVLIGSSIGGWLAAELAAWFPDRFTALVLIAASGLRVEGAPIFNIFGVPGEQSDLQAEIARRSNPHGVDLAALVAPAFADKDASPEDARMLHFLRGGAVVAQLGWNPYLHDVRLPGRLKAVRAPTLVLWGADDLLVPVAHGEAYVAAISNAELKIIAASGHSPVLEKPQATAEQIQNFLEHVGA